MEDVLLKYMSVWQFFGPKAELKFVMLRRDTTVLQVEMFLRQLMTRQKEQNQNLENLQHVLWRMDKYKQKRIRQGKKQFTKRGKVNGVEKPDFAYNCTYLVSGAEDKQESIIPVNSLKSRFL